MAMLSPSKWRKQRRHSSRNRPILSVRISSATLMLVMMLLLSLTVISVHGSAVSLTGSSSVPPQPSTSPASASASTVSSTSSTSMALVTTATANAPVSSLSTTSGSSPTTTSSPNMIVSLATYLKDSVVRTISGCGQLYSNHGRCNEIRKKLKLHRESLRREWEASGLYEHETPKQIAQRLQSKQGGITYDEYIFLERGKVDRGKVLNLGFLMWGAPRFLPYALMFNPDMLPSPFQADPATTVATGTGSGSTTAATAADVVAETQSRERAHAILSTLMIMEKQATSSGSSGMLASLNMFGKKKQAARQEQLQAVVAETGQWLDASPQRTASDLLQRLRPHLYQTDTDFTRAERRLCHVPSCIVQGLGRAVSGKQGLPGIVAQVTPSFLQRGQLVSHIQKVAAADDFLLQADIDLNTIPKRLLQEACQDRLIGGSHRSTADLRASLAEWLQLAATLQEPQPPSPLSLTASTLPSPSEPMSKVTAGGSADVKEVASPSTTQSTVYFNDSLARMALLAYNGCTAVRDTKCASRLPLLLCSGTSGSEGAMVNGVAAADRRGAKKDGTASASSDKKRHRIPLLQK